MLNKKGITLIELIIVVAIIGILAVVGIPEINRFSAENKVRSAATDLVQNMRLARAMAIKENREYLIVFDAANRRYMMGFDGDNDNNLVTADSDTFGICNDNDGDRLPNGDVLINGVPRCVKTVDINDYGVFINFGTIAPVGPGGNPVCGNFCFGGTLNPVRAEFNPNGSAGNMGSAYFQHTERRYSYVVRISNNAGSINMWKWRGDNDNPVETDWRELR